MEEAFEQVVRQIADLTGRIERIEQALRLPAAGVEPPAAAPAMEPAPALIVEPPPASVEPPVTPPPPRPSLESRIGGEWLNRIGIAAVFIGAAYFLKYAIDNEWIGPAGRIVIGLVAGLALIVWSEGFRRRGHRVFAYTLKVLGIGILYLSIWAAFQMYALISDTAAFGAMFLVTVGVAILALRDDEQMLAGLALAGGFATPILISTGANRQVELFSYLILLDVATLFLLAWRQWGRLLTVSFAGTVVLWCAWYASHYSADQLSRTAVFTTIFFVLFAIAPILPALGKAPRAYSAGILLVSIFDPAVYIGAMALLLVHYPRTQLAIVAASLTIFYSLLFFLLKSLGSGSNHEDELILIQLALAVGFLTIAIPLRFDGAWITIGWIVEAAALIAIGETASVRLLRVLGSFALVMAIFRLLLIDDFHVTTLLFNARFAAFATGIAALACIVFLRRRTRPSDPLAGLAIVAANLLGLVALHREVSSFFGSGAGSDWDSLARDFSYSAVWMAYGAVLIAVGFARQSALLRWQALALLGLTVLKVFFYDLSSLDRGYRILSFIFLGVLLLAVSFAYQRAVALSARSTR